MQNNIYIYIYIYIHTNKKETRKTVGLLINTGRGMERKRQSTIMLTGNEEEGTKTKRLLEKYINILRILWIKVGRD